MDCSLPGSSVHAIFQAIVLEWIVISFSRGSSGPRDQTWVSHIVDRRFTIWATRQVQTIQVWPKSNPLWLYNGSDKYTQGIRSDRQSAWRTMEGSLWYCTRGSEQDLPHQKKCKKAIWLSEEALQITEKRREAKSKGKKERYTYLNAEFQRVARRDKKAFLGDQCKEIEENNAMEWQEFSSRKLEIPREHFMQRWAQ